jgi:tetratricopeptide (TPR) repeat protein
MRSRHLLTISSVLFLNVALLGQGSKAPSNGTANPAQGPEATSDIGKTAHWNDLNNQGRSGDYLTGKVTVKDAAKEALLIWDPIPVSVSCDGQVKYTTTADVRGDFTIAPATHAPGEPTPKTDLHPVTVAGFAGCTVAANLAGFTSTTLTIANRSLVDTTNIGTIELKAESAQQSASTSASVSKDAVKSFEKARAEWLDSKPDRAQKDLEKAVQISPQFAEAWYQLGKLQEASNQTAAWDSYSKAVAADPQFARAYDHLAALAAVGGKWNELVDFSNHSLELNPRGTPQIFYYSALGNYNLKKKDVAETNALKALSMDPLHTQPNIEQLIAVILAEKGDYAGALQHLRSCLAYLPSGKNADIVKQQIAQLEKIAPASH